MKLSISTLIIIGLVQICNSQIVSLNPAFPTRTEEVTITFDATQGSKGLVGEAQVYAHTGVIVEGKNGWQYVIGNWGTDDPRVKMTNIGNNKHALKIRINDFYKVPATEKILQLTFVFRNVNGSKEGKTASNQDIFLPFTDSSGKLVANLETPASKSFIVNVGQIIPIKLKASKSSKMIVTSNGNSIYETTTADLNYNLAVNEQGSKKVNVKVGEGAEQLIFEFSYTTAPNVIRAAMPANVKPGVNIAPDGKVTVVLTAPSKQYVHLISSLNDWSLDNAFALNQTPDGTQWWLNFTPPTGTKSFAYQYIIDGTIRVGDPFSELVIDESNDKFLTQAEFADILTFPSDKTSGIASWVRLDKPTFNWTDGNYVKPQKERLNVYEVLIRDFVATRNYKTLTDTLNYLQKLGVNAIELMPIQEFEGNQSWGYNPSYHMALDKAYGTPEQFKNFVNEAHKRGIAVIQDVVFNHGFSQSPIVQMYWDAAIGKPSATSPYVNPDAKHPFNVGYDLNHESIYTQNYMDQILNYWMTEYHIDGFRFDLSKGFTQVQNTDVGAWSNYDASRIALLKRMASQVWSHDPTTYVILEHFGGNAEEKELAEAGMMLWANFGFNFNEATMGYVENGKSDVNNLNYKNRSWTKNNQIAYMESHDEERLMVKNISFGNVKGAYNTKQMDVAMLRVAAAANILLAVPGAKMIWQFGELGYDYSINACKNGGSGDGCRLDEKPIRWDYLSDANRLKLYTTYATLNKLRNTHEVFHTNDVTIDARDGYKTVRLNSDTLDLVAISNFEMDNATKIVTFTHSGTWYDIFSGTSISISSSNTTAIVLKPGEYRMYFDKKLALPDLTLNAKDEALTNAITLYPNPSADYLQLEVDAEFNLDRIAIFDINGKLVLSPNLTLDPHQRIDVSSLSNGTYFVQIASGSRSAIKLISVIR